MKRLIIIATVAAFLSSCVTSSPKPLILYCSMTGTTEKVAMELQKQTGADIERFDMIVINNGMPQASRKWVNEDCEKRVVTSLTSIKSKLKKYDVIFLAYPIWNGTYPPPVKALIKEKKLDGKKIIPVCTFDRGGLEESIEDLKEALPKSTIVSGFGIRHSRIEYAEEGLNRFLIENGFKEGQIEPEPDGTTSERKAFVSKRSGSPAYVTKVIRKE